jgi:hypothetical protein
VSVSRKSVQKPQTIFEKVIDKQYRPYLFTFLAILAATGLVMAGIRVRKKSMIRKLEVETKKKEEEENSIKPYWPGEK